MVRIFDDKKSLDVELDELQAGTVVVCPDLQKRCWPDCWLVFEVVDDPQERVLERGLFWFRSHAEIFAKAYHNLVAV